MTPLSIGCFARRTATATAIAVLFSAGAACAQAFPSKPLEMIVHTGPGAGNDRVARIVADVIARDKLMSQPITVINKVGGAGTVAFNYVKAKRADPHVILSGVGSTLISASLRPEYGISLEQFTPVALLARDPQAVMVSADAPWQTFRDFAEAARREPNSLVGGFGSPTSSGRMLLWQIERDTGGRFKAVSLKSGAQSVLAVMGGHVQVSTENVSEGISAVEGKKVRVLAVTATQRLVALPEVPTFRELGYSNINVASARGFSMAAGVPRENVEHVESVLKSVYNSPAWKTHAAQSHYENVWLGANEFGPYLTQRKAQMQEFLRAIGVIPAS